MVRNDEQLARLQAYAGELRSSGALGKSVQINRLFDFLVERSVAGRTPKEVEVAQDVFGVEASEQLGHDATVRMCIHRLRKKLEEVPPNSEGERLVLPRGDYRLLLVSASAPPAPPEDPAGGGDDAPQGRSANRRMLRWAILLALIVALIVGAMALRPAIQTFAFGQRDPLAGSALWRPVFQSGLPLTLVSGDRYIFGEANADGEIVREIRMRTISSSNDLEAYRKASGQDSRLVDLNLYDLPGAMAPALAMVAPVVNQAADAKKGSISVGSSQFTPDNLKSHNIVYVGLLGDLRDLGEPVFASSRFALSPKGDALVDRKGGGRSFRSDWDDPSKERVLRRDYAYIASLPGPVGNHVLVIAGLNEPALAEAAQIVTQEANLDALSAKVGNADAFEALYEVRTFGPVGVASRLVMALPVKINRPWQK